MLFFNFLFVLSGVYYIHPDHLGGAGLITDKNSRLDEVLDYRPYGSLRLDQHMGSHDEKRKYIGQEYDAGSGLEYLNARYYDPQLGRFLSHDPQFWPVLIDNLLIDPQQLNSYSYSRNNPIVLSDPTGLSSATYNPMPKNGWSFGQIMGQFNGVNAYYNGIGSSRTAYSCVEYAKRYMSQQYGINAIGPVGDAKTMWSMVDTINDRLQVAKSDYRFVKHANGTSELPGAGDLLFWTEGKYGHVMVVTESVFDTKNNKGHVEIIDQNASNKSVRNLDVRKNSKGYEIMRNDRTPVAGWFSPVKQTKTSPTQQPKENKPAFKQSFFGRIKQFFSKYF